MQFANPILIITLASIGWVSPVEIQIKDEKLLLVSSMIILVVIVSAFGYGWIVQEEARTGGMGEKWRMAASGTYSPIWT